MLRVNAINRQELLKRLTFHHKCLVFKTVSVPMTIMSYLTGFTLCLLVQWINMSESEG